MSKASREPPSASQPVSDRGVRRHGRGRGQKLGLTVGSLVSLSLEPSAHRVRRVQRGRDARAPPRGGWLRDLAPRRRSGVARTAFRARRSSDRHVARDRDRGGGRTARRCSSARSAGSSARSARRSRPEHTRSSSARVRRSELGEDAPALVRVRGGYTAISIEAVVFDLDGVLVDSEQVWDEVREELARERGGRWHERAQADMMGMSSTEWSRYMHDVIGLAEPPDGDQRRGRPADASPLRGGAAADRRRGGGVRRLAGAFRLALASSSNRPLIDAVLAAARPRASSSRRRSPRRR